MLKPFWNWISALGLKESDSPELAREVMFINQIIFLTFLVTFPSLPIIYLTIEDISYTLINFIFLAGYLVCLLINFLGVHQKAKTGLFIVASTNTFFACSMFGYASNAQFNFILIIFACVLTFRKEERWSIFLILSVISIYLLILIITDFSLFLATDFTPAQQKIVSWIVLYFGITGSVLIANYYLIRFSKQSNKLSKANGLLNQKYEELQKLNTELDRFVYSVSHDLRAPITSVLGLTYLGKRTTDMGEIQQYFDLQEKSLKKLDNFIADILNYSRNNRMELNIQEIDFQIELENILELQTQYDPNQKIDTKIEVQQEGMFFTDKQRLMIVLNNLVGNAFRYYNPYQTEPFICLSAEVSPQKAMIKVADNGIGIGKEHLSKIFEMFYRATDKTTGSGLGLYIVKEVVEKLKGKVSVESEVGKGTTFIIEIPNL